MKPILLLILAFSLSACSTNTGDAAKDRRGRVTNAVLEEAFTAAVRFGLCDGVNAMRGKNGQDAAYAAFSSAFDGNTALAAYKHVTEAYAGPQVANAAASIYATANPQTPADKALVVNTIGAGLQLAANTLAK